jgi:hypothetical protein
MDEGTVRSLLESVRAGGQSVEQALDRLRSFPFEDLGFAKIDHHRALRCGFPEVIYCEGKTVEQVAAIFERCAAGGGNVLATRASDSVFEAIAKQHPEARFHQAARAVTLRQKEQVPAQGTIGILAAGTSDLAVADEARVTAEIMDQRVTAVHDVGVAGLHRLLAHADVIRAADVLIVVAGMEGALPSVVGGLVAAPVIAVPTSVGYGASFGGIAALLGMLNTCAAGVTVVNIDNGFGAAVAASRINHL